MFVLNEFSLFFHNRRVETPPAKKNITNKVQQWVQSVPPPPKKLRGLAANSVVSKVSSTLTKSTKSASCAVVSASTSRVFPKPVLRAKRRAEEAGAEAASDVDEYAPSAAFGGLDEDEDDAAEWAAAAISPVKASAAARSSKVSIYTLHNDVLLPHDL
jgi:hypothetical protein